MAWPTDGSAEADMSTYLAGKCFSLDWLCSQVLLEGKYCRQKSRIYKPYLLTVIIIPVNNGPCNGFSTTALAPYFLMLSLDLYCLPLPITGNSLRKTVLAGS